MSVFELGKAEKWINQICAELQTRDEERAYMALRASLHALRDRLPVQEAAHLAAQLPMIIRGLFFEGWHPGTRRPRSRSLHGFLEQVAREIPEGALDPEAAARAVFTVVAKHVSAGQIENVRHTLPHRLAELWTAPRANGNGAWTAI
ncbi:MAG TPA: DUF2267 domain-containing protein [Myxococcales bacterium]|nr:DUF2267 domain-containing protein [Myxococcales bacterium]